MLREPSPQQQDIFDAIYRGDENILVDAKAGTGKTTTIIEGMAHIKRAEYVQPSITFLAFNKQIADTLKSRCPSTVVCSTFHALGLRALKDSNMVDRNDRELVDGAKCRKILYNYLKYDHDDFKPILRLVSILKNGSVEDDELTFSVAELCDHYDIIFEEPTRAVELAWKVKNESDKNLKRIDFDDMLHLPVALNARFDKKDWIFVDEAQDLNHIQHIIVERLYAQRSRLVAVGDPNQAIYGFRGAHTDSMNHLAQKFNMRTYPLSVSYRCPKKVVHEACKYLI